MKKFPSLWNCLTLPISSPWGDKLDTPNGPYFFQDNRTKILGVAHLDTVLNATPYRHGSTIFAPQLDDRLGVWCLLNALPRLGVTVDILLTTGEEKCQSTAYYFDPPRPYNWVVEFDRMGKDVVFYQYSEDRQWVSAWENAGFVSNWGSYSDIADLEHLEVCAANVGIGYHCPHTPYCWARLNDTKRQLCQFATFWQANKDREFLYTRSIKQDTPYWPEKEDYYDYDGWTKQVV